MDKGVYSVVLAFPEILLVHGSHLWLQTIKNRSNEFCRRLACIAVDEAHLLWGWRQFRKEYLNVGKLRIFFPEVPVVALLATITQNVLEYFHSALKLRRPTNLYKRTLDRPNITYIVQEIRQKGLTKLNMLIPTIGGMGGIPKTMIFVNNIDSGVAIAVHLQSLLPTSIRNKDKVVRSFSSNVEASTWDEFMRDFQSGNIRIWVCTHAAGMGIDIQDVTRVIQWKLSDHLVLATLLQRIGQAGQDASLPAVAIVFVQSKYILPENFLDDLNSIFCNHSTAIGPQNGARAAEIVKTLYTDDNLQTDTFQTKKNKSASPYHKVDPAVMWFVHTTRCRRCLALACFMSSPVEHIKSTCCDNCIYNAIENMEGEEEVLPAFERYGVTAKHYRRYLETKDCERQVQQSRLDAIACTRRSATKIADQEACIVALSDFANETWHGMAETYFLSILRQKIAGSAAQIASVEDLSKILRPQCLLQTSTLRIHAPRILGMIGSIISSIQEEHGPGEEATPDIELSRQRGGRQSRAGPSRRPRAEREGPRAKGEGLVQYEPGGTVMDFVVYQP